MSTPILSADEYVARTLGAIDWSKPATVLFLKGIGDDSDWEHKGRAKVAPYLDATTTGLTQLLYGNVQAPLEGVASGSEVLTRVIREIKRRSPQMHVWLAGVSLGAWTIGDTIAGDPAIRQAIDGAALFAHSATARAHYPTDSGPIREFNYPGDRFTEPFHGSREKMVATLERLYQGMNAKNIVVSLPQIVTNLPLFLQFQQWMAGKHTPHADTDKLNPGAYAWIAGNIAASLHADAAAATPAARVA